MWEIKAEVQKSFWEVSVFVCFSSFFLLGEREKERKVEWGRENMIRIHFMEISFSKII